MAMNREYFTVELASEIVLGIALTDMATVVQFETKYICAVPGVAEFWHGVVNFKGSLLWVLDGDRFLKQSLMGERTCPHLTPALDSFFKRGNPANELSRKTALHRFLNLPGENRKLPQKLTAIIIRDRQKQVALATQRLNGIVEVEPSDLKSLADDDSSLLHQCCSAIAKTEVGSFYTLDSAALVQQLHQRSSLVSV